MAISGSGIDLSGFWCARCGDKALSSHEEQDLHNYQEHLIKNGNPPPRPAQRTETEPGWNSPIKGEG